MYIYPDNLKAAPTLFLWRLKDLAAEYFDLRQAFENAHQRVYLRRQTRFGHHGNIARLDTEKDRYKHSRFYKIRDKVFFYRATRI